MPVWLGRGMFVGCLVGCLAACGSKGPPVSGPAAQTLFAQWNGSWTLDEDVSDDPSTALTAFATPARAVASGARGGGRGGGGRGGGGRGGGQRGGGDFGGSRPASIDIDRLAAVAGRAPEKLSFELSDSLFVVREIPGSATALPMDGSDFETSGRVGYEGSVSWDDLSPSVKRNFEDLGEVTDEYELLTPKRLSVTRTISAGGRSASFRLLFDRTTP